MVADERVGIEQDFLESTTCTYPEGLRDSLVEAVREHLESEREAKLKALLEEANLVLAGGGAA